MTRNQDLADLDQVFTTLNGSAPADDAAETGPPSHVTLVALVVLFAILLGGFAVLAILGTSLPSLWMSLGNVLAG